MKKIFILTMSLGFVLAASAQYGHRGYERRPRVTIGVNVGPAYYNRPYEIERRIAEINREYDHRIWEVRHDHYLRHREKKRMIRDLTIEREQKIREIRRWNY